MQKAAIIGTGSYLPGPPISNEQLESKYGREMIWLCELLGSNTRYFSININKSDYYPLESNADMAYKASKKALENAEIDSSQIDFIIMATSTPDFPFPATVLYVQEKLNIGECSVIELRAGCGGMAQAFLIGSNMIENGSCNNILLIGSDLISPYMNLFSEQKSIKNDYLVSLAMFGDGAGAVIIGPSKENNSIIKCFSRSMSTGNPAGMRLNIGGALNPIIKNDEKEYFLHDYKAILKNGKKLIRSSIDWIIKEQGYKLDEFDYFIPPQVNEKLISSTMKLMNVDSKKIVSNYSLVGNTVSASIYIALDQLNKNGIFRKGDLLALLPCEGTKWVYGAILVNWDIS